jgi:hypothetical protein
LANNIAVGYVAISSSSVIVSQTKINMKLTFLRLIALFGLVIMLPLIPVVAQDTCDFRGEVFNRGDALPLETACGSAEFFPCTCNPDLAFEVECRFCGYATSDGTTRCARHGQTITFIGQQDTGQSCGCSVPNVVTATTQPVQTCVEDPLATVCQYTANDGSVTTYQPGDALPLDTLCGPAQEFPCFCNPNYPGKIECPYCGMSTSSGTVCIRDGETKDITNTNGILKTCSCQVPDPFDDPVPTCTVTPTSAPVPAPPATPGDACLQQGQTFQDGESFGETLDNGCGLDYPSFCNTQLQNNIEFPYCAFANQDGTLQCARDGESLTFNSGSVSFSCKCAVLGAGSDLVDSFIDCGVDVVAPPTEDLCTLPPTEDGTLIVVIENGETFGDLVAGPCGSASLFPTKCNTNLPNNVEYPYCVFEIEGGDTMCARDGESVTYTNALDVEVVCGCIYVNAALGALSTCIRDVDYVVTPATPSPVVPSTPAPTSAPTETIVQTRDSSATTIGVWTTILALVVASFCI